MQIPYSFLERSLNKQFKDLAFFQILKRKGPYIQRSITKIQNDLFYKHKLSGHKIKNVAFVKEIRLTLAAYEIIVNQIKNDFMMTELDSLGDSIHKLFLQMISIINFFSTIILKKQKLALNELIDLNLQQLKEKQQTIKKMEEEQKNKLSLEKQKENDRVKQIQKLKFNFRQLFKLQGNSEKQNKLIESLWKTIVLENKKNVQESIKIKDSQLNIIIKDSCQYLYKNHTELDNIVRLTKQDILTSQKTLNSFTDKAHLIQDNQQKIIRMNQVANNLVSYVRQKVYDNKNVQVQTVITMNDTSRPYLTTKEVDEKRKMELKIINFQKTFKEKQAHIELIEQNLKQTQLKLQILQEKYDYGENYSQSDDQTSKHMTNNLANRFISTMSRKSKHQNFNSFKIPPTSKTSAMAFKSSQASFTMGKKFSKLSKNLSSELNPFSQKNSKRSSTTFKGFNISYRNSNYNNQSVTNMISNSESGSLSCQKIGKKKFHHVRESNLVIEEKTYEHISRKSQKSKPQTELQDQICLFEQIKHREVGVSIDQIKSCNQSLNFIDAVLQEPEVQHLQKPKTSTVIKSPLNFTIIQTFKINIRPKLTKRYLQSATKHHPKQLKQSLYLKDGNLESSKGKKYVSQKQVSRYFFEPLNSLQRFGLVSHYRQSQMLHSSKMKTMSCTSSPKNLFEDVLHFNNKKIEKSELIEGQTASQVKAISFIKLKNQKHNKSSLKQNSSILKAHNKKQPRSILKKSSTAKQSVSFSFLPKSERKHRQSMYIGPRQEESLRQGYKIGRYTIAHQDQMSMKRKEKNEIRSKNEVIDEEIEINE